MIYTLEGPGYQVQYLEHKGCIIDYSMSDGFHMALEDKSIVCRYVLQGLENYQINQREFRLKNNELLITNRASRGVVFTEKDVKSLGICISLSDEYLREIISSWIETKELKDTSQFDFLFTDMRIEKKLYSGESSLNRYLSIYHFIFKDLESNEEYIKNHVLFDIGERALTDQLKTFNQLLSISGKKIMTKTDIFQRVCRGRDYIHDLFTHDIHIEDIASAALMSEFHFFRMFKKVFGLSPYQYLIQLRMNYANKILKTENLSVYEVALASGFTDIYAFSKAFRKYFSLSPTHLQKKVNSRF